MILIVPEILCSGGTFKGSDLNLEEVWYHDFSESIVHIDKYDPKDISPYNNIKSCNNGSSLILVKGEFDIKRKKIINNLRRMHGP